MKNGSEISTNPHRAADWLIEQANEMSSENGGDCMRADLFFAMAYPHVKQSLRGQNAQTLFVIAIAEALEKSQPAWYSGTGNAE